MPVPIATVEERLQLIKECYQSGLTVNEWCRQNGICRNTFHTRITGLKKKGLIDTEAAIPGTVQRDAGTPEIVRVEINTENSIPVKQGEENHRRRGCEERSAAGAVMEIDPGGIRINVKLCRSVSAG